MASIHLRLRSRHSPDLELKTIDAAHLELMRRLKNDHRHRFFAQTEITPAQQQAWFNSYLSRADDWMFAILSGGAVVGCAGYRVVDGAVDLYNLLREPTLGPGADVIGRAFDMMCVHAATRYGLSVRGRVLVDNPAIHWFEKRGFAIAGEGEDQGRRYYIIERPWACLRSLDVQTVADDRPLARPQP